MSPQNAQERDDEVYSMDSLVTRARDAAHEWLARLAPNSNSQESGAPVGTVGTGTHTIGVEHPNDVAETIPTVARAFAFLDLCGFTSFTAMHGEHAAIDELRTFRGLTREVAARRGVRVDKWLGDGAMIVGVDVGPTIAAAVEIVARCAKQPLALRGGFAHGNVLILDGDDYIGRPINLAARLCESAGPGELLAMGYPAETLAPWIVVRGTRSLTLQGLGRVHGVQQLGVVADL
jgi:adenylate cyclase